MGHDAQIRIRSLDSLRLRDGMGRRIELEFSPTRLQVLTRDDGIELDRMIPTVLYGREKSPIKLPKWREAELVFQGSSRISVKRNEPSRARRLP